MKMRFLLLCVLLSAGAARAATPEAIQASALGFGTADHERIATTLYSAGRGNADLVILAVGFAQYKDSSAMLALCRAISLHADTLCMDFRGTGQSTGTFEFGAREYLDLAPLLDWGRAHYRRTTILGFSLGAYSAIRAAAHWPDKVDRLLLVSCPTKIDDIIWRGDFINSTLYFWTHPGSPEGKTGANFMFRWGWLFMRKPSARDLAARLSTPMSFLVGGNDRLVPASMTNRVYERAAGERSWTEFPAGDHAEAMYLQFPELFMDWIVGAAHLE